MTAASARPRGKGRRNVHGVLLLDKPAGMSSSQAVQVVKRLYHAARVGHTGTLDPLATGLLVVALGEATKFTSGLLEADKAYAATIRLGVTTATGDAEGEVLATCAPRVTRADVERVLPEFIGEIDQVPPMHSALKKDGRPLYAYARAGEAVERPARRVKVHALEIEAVDGPDLRVVAHVGKGTYIRTLAEDVGRRLGCGAHLAALRRTRVGPFRLESAVTLDAIEGLEAGGRERLLLPVDAMLADLPRLGLGSEAADRFLHGQAVDLGALGARAEVTAGPARIYGPDGTFLGRGQVGGGHVRPERVVAADTVRAACGSP